MTTFSRRTASDRMAEAAVYRARSEESKMKASTKFDKSLFDGTEYVVYGQDRKFVARFKYNKRERTAFVNFLVKNFTVQEYFTRLESGEAPLRIIESKGYLSANFRKLLKAEGYPETVAGKQQYLNDYVRKFQQKG